MSSGPFFTISLDFELFWGLYDITTIRRYGRHILGIREAVPAMLRLFRSHGIHVTWATVGFITFATRKELLSYLPDERPEYLNPKLDPYRYLMDEVGDDESSDPYHFGYSLVRMIQDVPGMEIGSHTFSHFYCLEARSNPSAYRADLMASVAALQRLGVRPRSLVFCRNQYDSAHLRDASECGFEVFRGSECGAIYKWRARGEETTIRRMRRWSDAYLDISGPNASSVCRDESGLINVPSSCFLRPYSSRIGLIEPLRLRRIQKAMTFAASAGEGFHLWWHPFNFGTNLEDNIVFLSKILTHFRHLQDRFGMQSLTMSEAAELEQRPGPTKV